MCAPYGRKPYVEKVDTIQQMKECASTTDVQRSLGACIFYHIWIHHFAQREREKKKMESKKRKREVEKQLRNEARRTRIAMIKEKRIFDLPWSAKSCVVASKWLHTAIFKPNHLYLDHNWLVL